MRNEVFSVFHLSNEEVISLWIFGKGLVTNHSHFYREHHECEILSKKILSFFIISHLNLSAAEIQFQTDNPLHTNHDNL